MPWLLYIPKHPDPEQLALMFGKREGSDLRPILLLIIRLGLTKNDRQSDDITLEL